MKKIVIYLLIGLVIGFVAGITVLSWLQIPIDTNRTYGALEAVYFIVSPIAALITLFAVLVALWGNEIKMWLHREKCDVSIDKNMFIEDITGREDAIHIEAKKYDCNLCVDNVGGSKIDDLGLFIRGISFRENKDSKIRNLKVLNQKALYWNKPEDQRIVLLQGDKKYIPILRIHPSVTNQTPDDKQSSIKPPHISIMGYSLEDKNNTKGIWEVKYALSTTRKQLMVFSVVVSWNGVWKPRETEMNDVVTVELIKK